VPRTRLHRVAGRLLGMDVPETTRPAQSAQRGLTARDYPVWRRVIAPLLGVNLPPRNSAGLDQSPGTGSERVTRTDKARWVTISGVTDSAVAYHNRITLVDSPGLTRETRSPSRERAVLVVHGRDEQAKDAVFGLLRRLDLHPLEWEDAVSATTASAPFLGEVVTAAVSIAQVAIVLLTPDDIVMTHPTLRNDSEPVHGVRPTGQASPSVLLELGMLLAANPDRTIIVQIGDVRPVADLAGRNLIRLDGSAASLGELVSRLKLAGSLVNDAGTEWRDTSPFIDLDAYARRPG